MKVTNLRFQNFKSLSDVSFEPGRVNVLIGPNGAGKTAILEALGFCAAAMSGAVDNDRLQRRGIRLSVPKLYLSAFQKKQETQISLLPSISFYMEWTDSETTAFSCYTALGLRRLLLRRNSERQKPISGNYRWGKNRFVYKRDSDSLFDSQNWSFSPGVGMEPEMGSFELYYLSGFDDAFTERYDERIASYQQIKRHLSSYGIYQPTTPVLRGVIPDPSQNEPIGLNGGRLAEAVKGMIRKDEDGDLLFGSLYMDDVREMIDWMEDIQITAPKAATLNANVPTMRNVIEFQDRYMRPSARFTAYDASEGALYALFLLTLAMCPDAPPMFAVDNFDQALNPRLAKHLTKIFCDLILEQEKQAFLTTHNPLVLDGLDLSNDDIRLFSVNRDSESGETYVERVELNPNLMEKDQPLSRLWANGYLGGVPNL